MNALLAAVLLFAASDTIPIEEGDVAPEEVMGETTAPVEDGEARVKGGDFTDPNFLFTVPSPGPEWIRISPVETAPNLRAAFVHVRGDKVLAMITVGVDPNPTPKDPAGYAQAAFKTLTSPPLLFKVDEKGAAKLAGRNAFTISYHSGKGDRGYEQVYLPGASGSLVVLTFQAPKASFAAERAAFRKSAGAIKFTGGAK